MSPTAQLPPRFPHHGVMSTHTGRLNAHRSDMLQKHEITSHDIPFEDQSWWVDDLVGTYGEGRGKPLLAPLQRSVSDPLAILEQSSKFDSKFDFDLSATDDEIPELVGTNDKLLEFLGKPEGFNKLGSSSSSMLGLTPSTQTGKDSNSALSSILSTQMEKNVDSTCGLNLLTLMKTGGLGPVHGLNSPKPMEKGSSSVFCMCSPRHMEQSCSSVYGPNSPRQMEKLTHPESSMVSAIFESTSKNSFEYAALDHSCCFDANVFGSKHHVNVAFDTCDDEKISQRRAGQRSRIRKVQYIAELERTVNFYEKLGADLAARVAMIYQQRAALSVENKTLKQQISILERNKLIKEGQHHFLKNELKKLKVTFVHHRKTKSSSCFPLDAISTDASDFGWRISKLSLEDNTVPALKPEFWS